MNDLKGKSIFVWESYGEISLHPLDKDTLREVYEVAIAAGCEVPNDYSKFTWSSIQDIVDFEGCESFGYRTGVYKVE